MRDKLLGLEIKDRDFVVVGSSPDEMIRQGFKQVGKDFPVFLEPESKEEYALARTERKVAPGYGGFIFHAGEDVTLENDLRRRDLTINAIAEDRDGNVIDPFNGRADLEQGILRHVSPSFVEDPLRVLRVARFAARFNFQVADETIALMEQIAAGKELNYLALERVWAEIEKALATKYPQQFLSVLRTCNALKVLLPEVEALFGVPQPAQHHPEIDTGIHTMMVLEQAARLTDDLRVRFAALTHDLGKAKTPREEWPSHHGHAERGVVIIEQMCDRLKIPRQYRELAVLVSRFHIDCHRIMEMRPGTVLKKLEALDAFRRPDRFRQFLLVCEADIRGRAGFEDMDYPQSDFFVSALAECSKIDVQELLDQGFVGMALAGELRKRRVDLLAEAQ